MWIFRINLSIYLMFLKRARLKFFLNWDGSRAGILWLRGFVSLSHVCRKIRKSQVNLILFSNIRSIAMFVTAVCLLCLIKLRWPKKKTIFDFVGKTCKIMTVINHLEYKGQIFWVIFALVADVAQMIPNAARIWIETQRCLCLNFLLDEIMKVTDRRKMTERNNENNSKRTHAIGGKTRDCLTDMRKWVAAQDALRRQTKTSSEQGAARLPRWSQRGNKVSDLLVINSYFCAVDHVIT